MFRMWKGKSQFQSGAKDLTQHLESDLFILKLTLVGIVIQSNFTDRVTFVIMVHQDLEDTIAGTSAEDIKTIVIHEKPLVMTVSWDPS